MKNNLSKAYKNILLILCLTTTLNAGSNNYAVHAVAGLGIYLGCLLLDDVSDDITLDETTCLISVAIVGIGKEIYDKDGDPLDVAATMVIPLGMWTLYEW